MAPIHMFLNAVITSLLHGGLASALLQSRADATVEEGKKPRRVLIPDISERLAVVDYATSSVEDLVQLVNDTTVEALASAVSAGRGLYTALLEAKDTTGGLDQVVGKDTAAKGVVLFERLSYTLEAHPSEAAEAEERMQILLHDILRSFEAAGQECRNTFITAHDSAVHVKEKAAQTSRHSRPTFLEELRMFMSSEVNLAGLFEWFKDSFSRPGTPCEESRASIGRADKTVEHMRHMLLTVNASLCTSMLEGAQQSIGTVAALLREEMEAGKASYAVGLPSTLLSTVRDAVEETINVMERTMTSTSAAKEQVTNTIKTNLEQLNTLHTTSTRLATSLTKACAT